MFLDPKEKNEDGNIFDPKNIIQTSPIHIEQNSKNDLGDEEWGSGEVFNKSEGLQSSDDSDSESGDLSKG